MFRTSYWRSFAGGGTSVDWRFFGSVLREDFTSSSDVDVLIEFEPGHVPGLEFFRMERELSELLGRKVDLNTPAFLGSAFREQAMAEAEVQYVAP